MSVELEPRKWPSRKPTPMLGLTQHTLTALTPHTLLEIASVMLYLEDEAQRLLYFLSRALRLSDIAAE